MSVIRIRKKERNFVILDKTCLSQPALTWGAKGLHSYLMGLHDDVCVKVEKLVEKSANGRDAVRGYINELKKAGYITTEWIRKAESGAFERLEYVVHELAIDEISAPEKPSPDYLATDQQATEHTATAFQAPDNQATENQAPYINNNYLNKTNIKNNQIITTAANSRSQEFLFGEEKKKAAAVISDKNKPGIESSPTSQPVSYLGPEDAVIGFTLTPNQQLRIASLARKLNPANFEKLNEEISYCVLNLKHFTGCGLDFGRKLNAIRKVILLGEWQTPANMVLEEEQDRAFALNALESQLHSAYAERNHFQRLLDCSKESAREGLEAIIQRSKNKASQIEDELRQMKASLQSNTVIPIRR